MSKYVVINDEIVPVSIVHEDQFKDAADEDFVYVIKINNERMILARKDGIYDSPLDAYVAWVVMRDAAAEKMGRSLALMIGSKV